MVAVPAAVMVRSPPSGDFAFGSIVGDERDGCRLCEIVTVPSPGEFYGSAETTSSLDGAILTITPDWVPDNLSRVQAILCARIDQAAEQERLKHITPGEGQAMVYLQKYADAKAAIARVDGKPYPLIVASTPVGGDLLVTARTIVDAGDRWMEIAGVIESVRMAAKTAIRAATTVPDAVAAAQVTWG